MRILIVDDDVIIVELVQEFLSQLGHDVIPASDGAECLRHLATAPFDLVITDLLMPGKEGIETIFEIRKLYPKLPIIAISGGGKLSGNSLLVIAESAGADLILQKPFTPEEIQNAVSTILDCTAP